jgi:hypothetical protein
MSRNKVLVIVALIVAAAALLVILEGVDFPEDTYLLKEIKNAGHIPLFGLMSLVVLGMSFALLNRKLPSRIWHYLVAFLFTGFLGFLSELFQKFTPRDADFWDIMRDIAGAAIFLLIWMTFDKNMRESLGKLGRWGKPLTIWSAAVIIGLVAISPVIQWTVSYKQRSDNFPVICSFDTEREADFADVCRSDLSISETPSGWSGHDSTRVGRWDIRPGDWPQIYLEPYPDWGGYNSLDFDTFSTEDTALTAILRIADYTRDGAAFDRRITIQPGLTCLSIPIEDIRTQSRKRPLDITDIRIIQIIFEKPRTSFTIYLDNLRLI